MKQRRLVGIDLGIASAHTVRVLAEDGLTIAKRKAFPTLESLTEIERAALAGAAAGTRLEVVIEPTGPAWLPIAVFSCSRGHVVNRVASAKAADLRRLFSRHAKSNGIDADTLARLPRIDPAGLRPLELPGAELAALDRRVRAADRLTQAGAEHKARIKSLVRQLMPMTPLTGDLGMADLAVLERFADPNLLIKVGVARLTKLIARASKGRLGTERAEEYLVAAHLSLELYGDHPAVAFADLAAEVATEVRLLRAISVELSAHAPERESCHHRRALQRDRGGAPAPTFQEEGGEGPPESPRQTFEARRAGRRQTGRPSPAPIFPAAPRRGQGPGGEERRPVTGTAPLRDDGVTMACPACERAFEPVGRRRWCSPACRQAAYRRRHQPGAESQTLPPLRASRSATVHERPDCGTLQLGDQRCADCGLFGRRKGPGGRCPHCDEPVAVADLFDEAVGAQGR